MKTTSLTLLSSIETGSDDAWARLDAIYRPFVYRWFRRRSISHEAAEDLTQDVMLVVARELPNFEHSGRPGAFRTWLRRITLFEEKAYWRKMSLRGQPVGGTDFHETLQELGDAGSELTRLWEQQHDRHVLQKLLSDISPDFDPKTMQAFRRLAIDDTPPQQVADELGMSVGAVYTAKSRVVRRLRAVAEGLVDDESFS